MNIVNMLIFKFKKHLTLKLKLVVENINI
jgi:hypothetical protein